jgi:hypothetical protein
LYPVGHFGFVPVTLIVLPFFTQVIVFFALFALGEGDTTGLFELLGVGVGVGVGVGDSLATTEFVGVGDGLSVATGAGVGN